MVIEISVACIAAAFVILVVFLIIGIVKSFKTMREMNALFHSAKKDLDEVSVESVKLIKDVDEMTCDIKETMEDLHEALTPHSKGSKHRHEHDFAGDVAECLNAGLVIYQKIREGIEEYGKRHR